MNKPTGEQLQQMKQQPIETVVVLVIDLMILPLHFAYKGIEFLINRYYGRRKETEHG